MIIKSGVGKPGDVKDWRVTHNGKDITGAILSATIFQNIFSPTWSCNIQVNDTNNLLVSAKLDVGDTVKVKVETKFGGSTDAKKEFTFEIIKISGRQFLNSFQQSYTIECVNKCFIENNKKRIIKSFKDKFEHEIVEQLVPEFNGKLSEKDESENKLTIIFPNFSPLTAINLLCRTATKDSKNDFLFYQIEDSNQFAFKSVEEMYSDEVGSTLRMTPAQQTEEVGDYDPMLNYFDYIIEDIDQLRNDAAGFNGNKLIRYDFVNKCVETTGESDVNVGFVPKHDSSGSKFIDLAPTWFTSRKAAFKTLEEYRMIVQLHGGAKMAEWLGKSIKVMVPSQQDYDESQKTYDKQLKGKWLVGGITHFMGHQNYAVNLELLKIKKGQ